MADVYVNALTQITSEPTSTDSLVLVNRNTNEGKIIDYNKLADVILAKLASKQFSSLTTASKLLPGAINELDADTASMATQISQLNSRLFADPNGSFTVDRMNSLTTPGIWAGYIVLSTAMAGGEGFGLVMVGTVSTYVVQVVMVQTGTVAIRRTGDGGATWSNWGINTP